jgi:HK97 family phage major capsid protein
MDPIQKLRQKAAALNADAQLIADTATKANRDMTVEEIQNVSSITAQATGLLTEAEARESLDAQAAALAAPRPRRTETTFTGVPTPGATSMTLDPGHPITGKENPTGGFRNVTEFLCAIAADQIGSRIGKMDPGRIRAAVATYSSEGTGADGGYALPPDFRAGVQKLLDAPESLFPKLAQLQTPNFTVTLPVDEDTPWSASGLAAAQVAEGAQISPVKPVLKQLTIPLVKYGDLAFVTEEMLADGTLIGPYIQSKCADKIGWKVNNATYQALLTSAGRKTTGKGATGAGAPATLLNLQAMLVDNWVGGFNGRSVWVANPAYITVLQGFTIGNWPVYLPPGGLSNSPLGTLFGRPIIFSELCNATGTEGDIMLFTPDQVYGVTKTDGLRADQSIHFAFDQDMTAFRFYIRAAIKHKWSATITRPDSTTASSVVTLQSR